MDTHRHAKSMCRRCGYEFDAATFMGDGMKVPEDGDISICFRCGELAIFEDGTPRPPVSPEEIAAAAADPHVREGQITARVFSAMMEVTGQSDCPVEVAQRLTGMWDLLRLS